MSLDPTATATTKPLPLPRPRPTLPPLSHHSVRSDSQRTREDTDDDEQKWFGDPRTFGSPTATGNDSPIPYSPSSFSPKPLNVLQLTPSARQLATRLKPLPSPSQSNLRKRERPKVSIVNGGRGEGDDNDGGGDKTHNRTRPRSPAARVLDNNKFVRIPPPLLPSPHLLKPLVTGGNGAVGRSATTATPPGAKDFGLEDIYSGNHAAAAGVLTDTMVAYRGLTLSTGIDNGDRVRRKPPPRLPGLSRSQLSNKMSSNTLSLSSKSNVSTTIDDHNINTTTSVDNTTTTNTNVLVDVDMEAAFEGHSNIESSFSTTTTTTKTTTTTAVQGNTSAHAHTYVSKVTFNLPEISSGSAKKLEALPRTHPSHELTITPSQAVEEDRGREHEHVPPPQVILTPINKVKYMSWFDI